MASIARLSIERPLYTWLLVIVLLVGGVWGLNSVGRLEDPKTPFSRAIVVTVYDGASAAEVEQEVTEVIEAAIQRLPHFQLMFSKSLDGRSEVTVEVDESRKLEDIPQIWDELRRRIRDAEIELPPGADTPMVRDDFADVFGLMYAVAAPGYDDSDVLDIARTLETAVKSVPGITRVSIDGEPVEAIYLEFDHARLTRLGLPIDVVFQNIALENAVMPAGSVRVGSRRMRIAPDMAFDSVAAIENLRLGRPGTAEIIRLGDIARVVRERIEVPFEIIRHNGQHVFSLGLSVAFDRNVVDVGKAVDRELARQLQTLPVGVTLEPIYAQHVAVEDAIQTFFTNLLLSVGTVVLALCLFMGWRAGAVVGVVLALSVVGTFLFMPLLDVQIQRISLGALMIAMGMLVDNGIVVAEGMVVGVRKGLSPADAAERAVQRTKFPLLGATIIGIAAFAPISLSDDNAGHFLISLFQVVATSLLLSWVLAVTLIPLLGSYLLQTTAAEDEETVYRGWLFTPYRALLRASLTRYWRAAFTLVAITGVCMWAFQYVKPGFFPSNNSPLFYIDYFLPQGTDILATEQAVEVLEDDIRSLVEVESLTAFVGRGANRFTFIMNPQQPNTSYAQIVGRIEDYRALPATIAKLRGELSQRHPEAEVRVFRAEFTPGTGFKIEARFSGPSAEVLRDLADQALARFVEHDLTNVGTDWRQPALALVPAFDDVRARAAGITRQDVSQALAFASNGVTVGLYRDQDKLVPIIARAPAAERADVGGFTDRSIWSPSQQQYIPLAQVVPHFDIEAQNTMIHRRERQRTITALANPPPGHNPTFTLERVRPDIEAIPLPSGYRLEWGGEYESNADAMSKLGPGILLAVLTMVTLTILMFGKLTQPLIIWLTLPMIVCGVVVGLVATDLSLTFPAFLGLLSLIGMLIKNSIVLIDEIDKRMAEQGMSVQTILQASISRLRPVLLATGTTILGMVPLLNDAFFMEMAVCIMSGLAFATVLTLIAVPVFYRIALRKKLGKKLDNKLAPVKPS